MKREDLQKIEGLTKEQIDSIMGLHQKDVTDWKKDIDSKKLKIRESEDTIKDLNGKLDKYKDVDIEDLQKKNNDWQSKYDTDIAALKKQHAIEGVISSSKPKNTKALMALLDLDKVTLGDDGKLTGLDDQITSIKKDNSFLFEDDNPAPKNVNLGGNHSSQKPTASFNLEDAVNSHYDKGE